MVQVFQPLQIPHSPTAAAGLLPNPEDTSLNQYVCSSMTSLWGFRVTLSTTISTLFTFFVKIEVYKTIWFELTQKLAGDADENSVKNE